MEIKRILDTMNMQDKTELVCSPYADCTRSIRLLPALKIEHDGFKRGDGTRFPSPAAIACSFDPDLAYSVGKETGRDCCARGVHVTARVPSLALARPSAGERYRELSTDRNLTLALAGAFIDGVQSTGVGACPRLKADRSEIATVLKAAKPKAVRLDREDFSLALPLKEHGYQGACIATRGVVDERAAALNAGIDLSLGSGFDEAGSITDGLAGGKVSAVSLDESALGILKLIDETFDDHEYDLDGQEQAQKNIAYACDCAVLLKNDGVLPLLGDRVTVIGDESVFHVFGEEGGAEDAETLSSALKADRRVKLVRGYGRGEEFVEEALEQTFPEESVTVLLGAYEPDMYGIERSMTLPEEQLLLAERLIESGREVAAVVVGGGLLDLKRLKGANAVLYVPYLGDGGAQALKRILCGEVSPSGRLPEDFLSGDEVVYPFGHGLTYSSFEYGEPKRALGGVTLEIKNTGRYAAAEAVQVYSGDELVAFAKVRLKAGESKSVTLPLSGDFGELSIGASRTDIKYRSGGELRAEKAVPGKSVQAKRSAPERTGLMSALSDIEHTAGGKKLAKKIRKLALDAVGGDEKRADRLYKAACGEPLYRIINLSSGAIEPRFVESCLANKDGIVGALLKKVGITKRSDGAQ